MRKLFFLLPLLLMPAFASAGHNAPLAAAANRLDANAGRFYRQVEHLRGNQWLKSEARRFAVLSDSFAQQVSHNPRSPRLERRLDRLNRSFHELRTAVRYAAVRGNKNKLRKQLSKVGVALNKVESRVALQGRRASTRTRAGYVAATYLDVWPVDRPRRYRN